MPRILQPRFYNVPEFRNFAAALAANGVWTIIAPADNNNGRFLGGANILGTDAANAVSLALIMQREPPTSYANLNDIIAFSLGNSIGAGSQGLIAYDPPYMRFLPPNYGLYLISETAVAVVRGSVELFFDIEQKGR